MDIKMTQRVLLAHRQVQGRATDAAPSKLTIGAKAKHSIKADQKTSHDHSKYLN